MEAGNIQRVRLKADVIITVVGDRRLDHEEVLNAVLGAEFHLNSLGEIRMAGDRVAVRFHFNGDTLQVENW